MITAIETYLVVRRAAGFTLSNTEYLLRSFENFATDQKQTHIRTATAIHWASQARSVAQRDVRYQTVCLLAQYLCVEDSRHESPPTPPAVAPGRAEPKPAKPETPGPPDKNPVEPP